MEGIPTLKNFKFSNVRIADCPTLVESTGIHPAKPLDGFSLVNVTGTCSKWIYLANVRNAVIRDIKREFTTSSPLNGRKHGQQRSYCALNRIYVISVCCLAEEVYQINTMRRWSGYGIYVISGIASSL